jgi:hypothetical protein
VRITGVIEGFYGPPWTHDARLEWIDWLHEQGMTHYVWAAKAEPRHRDAWRDPFTDDEVRQFTELAARQSDVALAVGLTPGPDATEDDVVAKLGPAVSAGAAAVVLSCDDLPALGAGATHRQLAHGVMERLGTAVWIVPTHYCGVDGSPYLEQLCDGLHPSIEVMWAGRRVVDDRVDADGARRWADLIGRPPLAWDNTPVNDGLMRDALHLGPLTGRDPGLREVCSGVLWNPMEFALASRATLTSAAAWARGDDPVEAWRRFVVERGWYHLALATAFRTDPIWPDGATGDGVEPAWFAEMLAGLPVAAADVGLDPDVQPWIDAAREGATIAVDAAALVDRVAAVGPGTGVTMRQAGLAVRWRAWQRRSQLTFGGGPRIRPVLGQDHRGEFVTEAGMVDVAASLVDLVVARALGGAIRTPRPADAAGRSDG